MLATNKIVEYNENKKGVCAERSYINGTVYAVGIF